MAQQSTALPGKTTAMTMTAILALALGACSSKDKDGATGAEKPEKSEASEPDKKAQPEAPPEQPPETLETIAIRDVGGGANYAIKAPAGFKLQMQNTDADEILPSAELSKDGVTIVIEQPEAGFFELEQDKGMISRGDKTASFVHEAKVGDKGYELIVKSGKGKLSATLSRPDLEAVCYGGELSDRAAADKVLEICRTLERK